MATFLSKLFKPKWQSNNLETRKQAVALLDSFNPEDQKILLSLAENDASIDVQVTAIEKINDTEGLIKLHKNAKDVFKSALENRLYALASAQSLSIFDLITNPEILCEMIIKAPQAETFLAGLARIEHTPTLLKIAQHARNSHLRQAATELIETETELNQLFAHAKNKDKAVYQMAKSKLANLRAFDQEKITNQEKIVKLLKDLENLSQTGALQYFDVRLEHLNKQWLALKPQADITQVELFTKLYEHCLDRSKKLADASKDKAELKAEQQHTKSPAESAPSTSQNDEAQATITMLIETLHRFEQLPAKTSDIAALDALIKTQENRWIEAISVNPASKSQQISYQDGMHQLRSYLQAIRLLKEHSEQLEALNQSLNVDTNEAGTPDEHASPDKIISQRKTLKKLLSTINWPNQYAKPASIANAETILADLTSLHKEQETRFKTIESQIPPLLSTLDLALEEKQIKPASQALKTLQNCIKQLDGQHSHKYQAAMSLRINQLNDLRDWQGFASTPKQIELCEAMERLAETHIDPIIKADKIKAMQQEWKQLGGTGDKELWQRFKLAADRAFEPCALFFAAQQELKGINLKKRETLVAQLRDYLDNTDWQAVSSASNNPQWSQADWKTADKINRQARLEWKEAFPVDFKAGKKIQNQFNELIKRFDDYLEQEKLHNLELKQQVVYQANSLLNDSDMTQAIQQIKVLQEQWQAIGITDHKEDRKLWKAYRAICDEIFARREQEREQKRTDIDATIAAANDVCTEIEASLDTLSALNDEVLQALAKSHQKQLQSLPPLPAKMQDNIHQRIERVVKKIHQTLAQRNQQQRQFMWDEVARKASILQTVFTERSRAQAAQEMPDLSSLDTSSIESEFVSRTTLPKMLEEQLNAAWLALKENRLDVLSVIDSEQGRKLCIACEIAAGIDSPEADKSLRMQLQVNRLTEGLSGTEFPSQLAQLEQALSNWYLSLDLESKTAAEFEARVQVARKAINNYE